MNVQILDHNAVIPSRATEGSAGYDLSTIEGGYIEPMGRSVLRTGISIELPSGTYGRIAPRSEIGRAHV